MASRQDEFTAFAQHASPRLLGTAYLLCGDWHTAEDLTQTALAKVFASWHRVRNHDALHAYARRTLLNSYFVDCRRTRRAPVLMADVADLGEAAAPAVNSELRLALTAALATLPPRVRAIVVLRYWEDLSVDQVATQLGCSAGNVKSQSARALDKLRQLLGDALADPEDSSSRKITDHSDAMEADNGRDIAPHAV